MTKLDWTSLSATCRLHTACKIVKGFSRSVVCDLANDDFIFISNEIIDLIENEDNHSYQDILNANKEKKSLLIETLEKLRELNYLNLKHSNCIAPLDETWEFPGYITNAIIEVAENSNHQFSAIIEALDALGCKDIQFRFYISPLKSHINGVITSIEGKSINNIDIVAPFGGGENKWLIEKCREEPRLTRIVLWGAENDEVIQNNMNQLVIKIKQEINSSSYCGFILPTYFRTDYRNYFENKSYNSCLNGKVTIDKDGELRNCPAMKSGYGRFSSFQQLKDLVLDSRFRKYWGINKDSISTCRDCEFRYMCVDCRAFLEDPKDEYSKPLKCGYDPYTGEWTDWSTSPLKQKAIEYYEARESNGNNKEVASVDKL